MKTVYPFSAYDTNLNLKFSMMMWLTCLFLVRPFAILVLSVAKKGGEKTELLELIYGGSIATMYLETIAALPAILVLFALVKRKLGAPALIQRIWSRGRWLLFLSALLNILTLFTPIIWNTHLHIGAPELIKLSACVSIMIFLMRSERVKDTFNDFPLPDIETKT